jgi:hypothetical protein
MPNDGDMRIDNQPLAGWVTTGREASSEKFNDADQKLYTVPEALAGILSPVF